jgi:hypothetical protein
MKLYYGGAEVPSWRRFLAENNIHDVYLSYMGLRRRVEFKRPWIIADKFPEDQNVMLDSGAFTVNKDDSELTEDELLDIAAHYQEFVEQNIDRIVCFTEFDALPLGREWIEAQREQYDVHGDKFMSVWHSEYGTDELERLASRYSRIAIMQTSVGERSLVPLLNNLVARYGVKLHGLAMTKPDVMKEIRWDSVGSTSWISPSTFGDTHVWTGRELKRYPKAYKEEARKRHQSLFTNAGFDASLISQDDRTEVLRLAVWSWEQLMLDMNRTRAFSSPVMADPVTNHPESSESDFTEKFDTPVDNLAPMLPNGELIPAPPRKRTKEMLPGVMYHAENEGDEPQLVRTGDSLRQCNNCPLSTKGCLRYEQDAECGYALPIEIRNPRDVENVENIMIEMQTERVLFMKMSEDLDGFGSDPGVLSKEMDRLARLIKDKRDGNMEKTTIHISQQKPGELGMIGRIFGKDAADKATAYDTPVPVDSIIEATDVYESND